MKIHKFTILLVTTLLTCSLYITFSNYSHANNSQNMSSLLTDPFLQLPTENSVNVVWFTDFPNENNWVLYGRQLENKILANTTKLTRVREDAESNLEPKYTQLSDRDIWRHEATITELDSQERIPYQVVSLYNEEAISSEKFTLTSAPKSSTSLKILLTSDHQLMPLTTANLQKVVETIGRVDSVFFAGDLVNFPDRASEWFDDNQGGAFFPALQGKGNYQLEKNGVTTTYKGGAIIQYAPMFTALGNHEVMGRYSIEKPIKRQFYDAVPRDKSLVANTSDLTIIKNNSFNTDTYEEIFSLPNSEAGGKQYYAVTFGDIRLIVLYVTNIWRFPELNPELNLPARYEESPTDFNNPERWGYGQHIFEPIAKGSQQYQWLEKELQSDEFQQAKYKMVMFHHPPHTLGGNIVPPYTNPQQIIQQNDGNNIESITYEYPIKNDYIIRDLIPLLEKARVQFVYYGHSHLWNRFQSTSGMHFLESSNVGNSYGAHTPDNPRPVPSNLNNNPNYVAVGNPNGLEPIMPNIEPVQDEKGQPLPYIASNDITVFSILDTAKGTVSSYRFDTRLPNSEAIKFDEFALVQ
jgi:Calcineurin-like phosphoesterase